MPGGQFNQVAAHYGTQCTAPGDFAAEVDFELIQWPTPGGFNAGLNAIFADTGIWRHSAPWGDLTASWIAPVFVDRPLTPSTGSFRIVREGRTTSTYIRAVGGVWTLVNEAPAAPGSAVMGLQLYSQALEFQHLTGRVVFDNFTMSATSSRARRGGGRRPRTGGDYGLSSSSSSGTSRITRAGLPTTTARGGTSFVTTAPAPTNASSPISTPGQRIAPPPTRAPRRIVGPFISSSRFSVRPMKLSFVVTTHGATKTSSSSVEYAVT